MTTASLFQKKKSDVIWLLERKCLNHHVRIDSLRLPFFYRHFTWAKKHWAQCTLFITSTLYSFFIVSLSLKVNILKLNTDWKVNFYAIKKHLHLCMCFLLIVGPPGLEPGTPWLWVKCSNQLSYRPYFLVALLSTSVK